MTSSDAELSVRASRRNALVRRLYGEFPQVPAGFVADAVLQAWGDALQVAGQGLPTGASGEDVVERRARQRLLVWQRRAELASVRVAAGRRHAATREPSPWRHSA